MKYILQSIAFLWLLLGAIEQANAQYNNPILTAPADAQGAALGQHALMSEEMSLYTMPTTVLRQNTQRPLNVSYALGLVPTTRAEQRQYYHYLSSSYRWHKQHALLFGLRYWRGMPTIYSNGGATKLGTIYPQDWTIDIAYAYALNNRIKLSGGLSYLNTYNSQSSQSIMAHLQADYQGYLRFLKGGEFLLGASVRNMGTTMSFGKNKHSYNALPSYVEGAARISYIPLEQHKLQLGIALRYYTSILGRQALSVHSGAEYQLGHILSFRLGGIYQEDNSSVTMGLGRDFGPLRLSLAYSLHSYYSAFNSFNMGLSLSL